MKQLISIIVGIAAFIGVFIGVNALINLITSGFESNDLKGIAKVILWIFGFTITLVAGIFAGYMTGGITNILLTHKRKKRWIKKK